MLNVYAQEAIGSGAISIRPAIIRINSLNPGETYIEEIVVSTPFEAEAELQMFDITKSRDGAEVLLDPKQNKNYLFGMSNWIQFESKKIHLHKGENKISYKIVVPNNAAPGGHYASVHVKILSAVDEVGNVVGIEQAPGQLIIGRVPGELKQDTEVLAFTVTPKINIMWGSPFNKKDDVFTLSIKNNGNVDELIGGDIFIYSGNITDVKHHMSINPTGKLVLPETIRDFTYTWGANGGLIKKDNNAITINADYFRFGKYHALAKVSHYKDNNKVVDDLVVSFWIIPWYIIATIVLIGLILLWKIYGKTKRQK